MTSKLILGVSCSLGLLIGMTGCDRGGSHPDLTKYNTTNIKRLHAGYRMFWVAKSNRGPKNEAAFLEFLTTDPGAKVRLERIGVTQDDVPGIFLNERDGLPFKVRYGVSGPGDPPLVFEAEGVDGKRFVAYDVPKELDNDKYEICWSGKISSNANAADGL